MSGTLIIVSAPSGAGKTTLVGELLKNDAQVRPSISYTSRAPREGEQDGLHYHFVSEAEFQAMVARDEFLEWAQVHGRYYGTSRKMVDGLRSDGFDVILTIDIQGAAQARAIYPDAVSIFILPPSFETMLERLDVRGANNAEDLKIRLANAHDEIAECLKFDYIVINDELQHAAGELAAIIAAQRCRTARRRGIAEKILDTFDSTYVVPPSGGSMA
jgi:guanylate kinase